MSKNPLEEPAAAQARVAPRMGTGIEGLDEILEGGFPANRIYLIEGDPGTGKTTIALQFLREGARLGEAGLYVTLSETKEELEAVARSHGWTLEGFNVYELASGEERLKPESQYTIFHPSEIELSDTTNAVLKEVERLQPKRIVFDSLSEMRLLAHEALRYRRQILALKQYFTGRQCTVILLDDRTSRAEDLQLQSIVHGVLCLEHPAIEYGPERRRLRIIKLRGSRFRGGYHDFKIQTGGVEVFPRLVAAEHHQQFKRQAISSNVAELDSLLGGGLDRGTSTLILGPAGCGKSSLGAHSAASAAARGERSAIFLFDEVRQTYIERASGIGTHLRSYVDEERITIQQVDPAELSPGEFSQTVVRAVAHDEARVVVIDSLNGYLNAMPEERFLAIQMHELLTYLNQQGVITILIMAQHGFLGSNIQTPVDVSYLADTVLMLRYFEAGGSVRRAISVVKKRTGAHERTIREFSVSADGLQVGEPLTKFQGILTGVPTYGGAMGKLIEESDDDA
ncbi:MAG TPA: ATPase domain-containing protein [Pyrinomonadaceae bacterium]|jgi:circadian clock protein KaiC